MKVEFEIEDKEQLKDALNNAIIAYNQFYCQIFFCCEYPAVFEPLVEKYEHEELLEILQARLNTLHNLYNQL